MKRKKEKRKGKKRKEKERKEKKRKEKKRKEKKKANKPGYEDSKRKIQYRYYLSQLDPVRKYF